jgi:hypothetical protein
MLGEFLAAARTLREHIDPKMIAPELLLKLLAEIADHRAEAR